MKTTKGAADKHSPIYMVKRIPLGTNFTSAIQFCTFSMCQLKIGLFACTSYI